MGHGHEIFFFFIRTRGGSPLRDTGKLLIDIDDTDITTSIVSTCVRIYSEEETKEKNILE